MIRMTFARSAGQEQQVLVDRRPLDPRCGLGGRAIVRVHELDTDHAPVPADVSPAKRGVVLRESAEPAEELLSPEASILDEPVAFDDLERRARCRDVDVDVDVATAAWLEHSTTRSASWSQAWRTPRGRDATRESLTRIRR
jgi:hypothetical protein